MARPDFMCQAVGKRPSAALTRIQL